MSLVQPEHTDIDNRPSAGLTLNLSSNNPFRNRAASPASVGSAPRSPFDPPPRPVSRNPFLDASSTNSIPPTVGSSSDKMMSSKLDTAPKSQLSGNAAELFDNLTLNDRQSAKNSSMRPPPSRSNTGEKPPPPYTSSKSRGENVPPRGPPGHRPSRSQEEALRARKPGQSSRSSRPTGELDIFADPRPSDGKSGSRRVRRNSDSSVISKKSLDPEEEKRRAERRRRERRDRERGGKEGSSTTKGKKPRNLDIIDKLDVTSIYGTGLFHHDGPFDACNPHRNRQGSRRAPMSAFPKDSLNNSMGGSGPLNKRPDHATFLGNNDEEAFKDYSGQNGFQNGGRPTPHRVDSNVVSATTRIEPIHGEETLGLGTSTFLEGAPASRTAMQRRESETGGMETGGLGRKKSLAQRIKGINSGPRRDYGPAGRVTSPDGLVSSRSPDNAVFTPGGTKLHESNPFFNEYSKGDDSKIQGVTFVEPEKTGRPRAPSSPRRGFAGLERRATSDSTGDRELPKAGGGFLSRVKSLKGGPRKRPAPPPPQEA